MTCDERLEMKGEDFAEVICLKRFPHAQRKCAEIANARLASLVEENARAKDICTEWNEENDQLRSLLAMAGEALKYTEGVVGWVPDGQSTNKCIKLVGEALTAIDASGLLK